MTSSRLIRLKYSELLKRSDSVRSLIKSGIGRDSLGLISIQEIPSLREVKNDLLERGSKVIKSVRIEELAYPELSYKIGWNPGGKHIRIIWKEGQRAAGQEYITENIFQDTYTEMGQQITNRWPTWDPQFKESFRKCGLLMRDVIRLLAQQMDEILLEEKIRTDSIITQAYDSNQEIFKGRFLYYEKQEGIDYSQQEWGIWHRDYSLLTGLAEPFIFEGQTNRQDNQYSGLVVQKGEQVYQLEKLTDDSIVVQLGEVSEILSAGYFHSTPHCVRYPSQDERGGKKLYRSQFACFIDPSLKFPLSALGLRPNFNRVLNENILPLDARWSEGMTYEEFQKSTRQHYGQKY